MTVEKAIVKQLFRPITTGVKVGVNQSESQAIISNILKAREKSRVRRAIGLV